MTVSAAAQIQQNLPRCAPLNAAFRSAGVGRGSRWHVHPDAGRRTLQAERMSMSRTFLTQAIPAVISVSVEPSLQLATAKLPKQIDEEKFATNMYQWAATLTSSGQNMPFTLPLRVKKFANGFQISLLRINQGEPVALAHINAEVEEEPSVGSVLFVRFYEGEGSQMIRSSPLPSDPEKRLKLIFDGLVDVSTIMKTMQSAIKQTASRSLRPRES